MAPENIQRRLQKLRVMIEHGKGLEVGNARRLFDTLMEKYQVDETETEPITEHKLKYNPKLKRASFHLAQSLGLNAYYYTGTRRNLIVKCTQTEWEIFESAYMQIEELFHSQQKELFKKLDGFMYGFMEMTYPVKDVEPTCPSCDGILIYDMFDRRYTCKCGYKGTKTRTRNINSEGIKEGRESSGRLLQV